MKKLYLFLAFLCLASLSFSQLRMAIVGGPHSASVKEHNSIPSWETTIKPGFSNRPGLNLGILVDVPLSSNNRWYFQPGILYMEKGRKFYTRNDTATSILTDTISSSTNLGVNYIDIPLNLTYKLPLGKKATFFLSAGPYAGFFYNGKQKNVTRLYSSNSFKDENVRLESGNEQGKFKTFNAGVNARAAFEIGNVMLSGFMSEGLASFYTASYDGSFKHQVRGISLGIWLNKVKQPLKIANVVKVIDTDDDGVEDKMDKCPAVPGTKKYDGCPVSDRDGDGLNDEADVCPTVKGSVDFNGCPIPDSDGDGVLDSADKCTTEPGTKENNGCPVTKRDTITEVIEEKISFAARNIFFKAASGQLTESSLAPLDEVVQLLTAHPAIKLNIEGYTDSTGKEETNLKLSRLRAESVKKYLMDHGVDASRLSAYGYGSAKPLVSNETIEGRRRNRRVELKLAQ
ncbi:MAG TPA: OmpA family protein [Flavitalea sp.]|nr:OmpA family protein [Flavitalea sp.]